MRPKGVSKWSGNFYCFRDPSFGKALIYPYISSTRYVYAMYAENTNVIRNISDILLALYSFDIEL